MFMHHKKLQVTVRVDQTNPSLANLMLEQFGGPQGELAAAMRYFTQSLAEFDQGRKDMLLDIATEELSHLEVIGTVVSMLNKGARGKIADATEDQAQMYREISGSQNDSHVTQLLYGAGTPLTNSAGFPWTAAYIDTITEPTADLRSNIAAEARAKIIYERLINLTDDPGVRDTLCFLMTREIAHQKQFEKALYSIEHNFPPGRLQGDPRFVNVYFDLSQGPGNQTGPWNRPDHWKVIENRDEQDAVEGGDGQAHVNLTRKEAAAVEAAAERTKSNENCDPVTGAELGATNQCGPDRQG
jgi:Mn-containing catalase